MNRRNALENAQVLHVLNDIHANRTNTDVMKAINVKSLEILKCL